MIRGLKRPAEDEDPSESASVNSRTVQLPLPEGVDVAEADDIDDSDVLIVFLVMMTNLHGMGT